MTKQNVKYETEGFNRIIGKFVPYFELTIKKMMYAIVEDKDSVIHMLKKPYESEHVTVEIRYIVKQGDNVAFYVDKMTKTDNEKQSEYMVHRGQPYVDIQPTITNEGAQKVFEFVQKKYNAQMQVNMPNKKMTLTSLVADMLESGKAFVVPHNYTKYDLMISDDNNYLLIAKRKKDDKTEYKIYSSLKTLPEHSDAELKAVYDMLDKEVKEQKKIAKVFNMMDYFIMLKDFYELAKKSQNGV